MSINLHEIMEARAAIIEKAERMLSGSLSYIEGSRNILALLPAARIDDGGEFNAFVAIASETDRFPMGSVRDLWQQQALNAMQAELDRAEAWAKAYGEPACQVIIKRLRRTADGC